MKSEFDGGQLGTRVDRAVSDRYVGSAELLGKRENEAQHYESEFVKIIEMTYGQGLLYQGGVGSMTNYSRE